jgi:hypothetical protein
MALSLAGQRSQAVPSQRGARSLLEVRRTRFQCAASVRDLVGPACACHAAAATAGATSLFLLLSLIFLFINALKHDDVINFVCLHISIMISITVIVIMLSSSNNNSSKVQDRQTQKRPQLAALERHSANSVHWDRVLLRAMLHFRDLRTCLTCGRARIST